MSEYSTGVTYTRVGPAGPKHVVKWNKLVCTKCILLRIPCWVWICYLLYAPNVFYYVFGFVICYMHQMYFITYTVLGLDLLFVITLPPSSVSKRMPNVTAYVFLSIHQPEDGHKRRNM